MSPFEIPDAPPTDPAGNPIVGNIFITEAAASTSWATVEHVREHAIRKSGMFQLVGQDDDSNPDYTVDAGVDKYILEAMWFILDRNPEMMHDIKQSFSLLSGENAVALPLARMTRRVEIDSVELTRLDWDFFRDEEVANATGSPCYWTFEPAQASTSPGILVGPPPTEDVTVDVWGRFYPAQISDGGLIISQHTDLLIDATCFKIQTAFGRGSEATFTMAEITDKLKMLHIDQTAQAMGLYEDSDELLTMEG